MNVAVEQITKTLEIKPIPFKYLGMPGVLRGEVVSWGGSHFQIQAALPGLRGVIEEARRKSSHD